MLSVACFHLLPICECYSGSEFGIGCMEGFFAIGDLDALGILERADYRRPKFVHMNPN